MTATNAGKTIVIGGGTGFLGQALSGLLKRNGYQVLTISRKPGLNNITWSDLAAVGLPECRAVINLAGQNVFDPQRRWTPGFKQNVWASRIRTTESLADAIKRSRTPPSVFAVISGVGYYEPSTTAEYTEDSPGGDFDFLSEMCAAWEKASELPADSPVRRVIIRSGVVLGRRGGMVSHLIWPFFLGLGGPVGTGDQFMPWIHVEDMSRLFLYLLENEHTSGVYNGVAPDIITNGQFAKTFASQLWRPAWFRLPLFAVNWAFGEERAKIMTAGQRVIPKRILESGFQFTYPNIQGACKEFARLIYADEDLTMK